MVKRRNWNFGHFGGGPRRETIESIIEDFNNSQDILKQHTFTNLGRYLDKALAAVASVMTKISLSKILIQSDNADANQATNLQEYLDQEEENIRIILSTIVDTVVHEDEAYGLPFNTDTHVLFYNKDLFEEAGLIQIPPTTWDELEEMARQLDVEDGDSLNNSASIRFEFRIRCLDHKRR